MSCVGVAREYREFCGALVIDTVDAARADEIEALGVRAVVAETLMTDARVAAALGARHPRRGGLTERCDSLTSSRCTACPRSAPATCSRPLIADAAAAQDTPLLDGDCLVVTQKIVSKAEGRFVQLDPDDRDARRTLVESESVRILRRRGDLIIARPGTGSCARTPASTSRTSTRVRRAAARRQRPLRASHPRRAARARVASRSAS